MPPRAIDAVVLAHAHLDHPGYLPLLVRLGFRGPVYRTPPTADLCGLPLRDSGLIQEEDARRAHTHHYIQHTPALPLYTVADAAAALDRFRTPPVTTFSTHGETVAAEALRRQIAARLGWSCMVPDYLHVADL